MADVIGALLGAPHTGLPGGTPAFLSHTVDATNDGVAFMFQAKNAEAITKISFRYGARTGINAIAYVCTLESILATTGMPDGTDIGGGSPTAIIFSPPNDASEDGTLKTVTLTNPYTPTRGQILVATIRYSSGVDASHFMTFANELTNMVGGGTYNDPYSLRLTAGAWAKRQALPVFMVTTANTRYGFPIEGLYITRSASTVGLRQAMKFTLPTGVTNTFKILGLRFTGSPASAAAKNPILGLWDGAGVVIQNFTLDTDIIAEPSGLYRFHEWRFDEASLTALNAGTSYYIGLEVADAVNGGVLLQGIQLDAAGDLAAYPFGSNFHFATWNGSAWSDDTTVRPFAELILDDMTQASGGGGLLLGSGMTGGMRG